MKLPQSNIHLKIISVLCLVILPGTGCTTHEGTTAILNPSTLEQIHSGKTTKQDITKLLGEPEEILFLSEKNENWIYTTTTSDISYLAAIPVVPMFLGVVEQNEKSMTIEFDTGGVVRRIGHGHLRVRDRGPLD